MFRKTLWKRGRSIPKEELERIYGIGAIEFFSQDESSAYVLTQEKEFDLIELEQLLQAVGWSRRPIRRVKRALDNSLCTVGLWKHDSRFPRLIGFARCTGDGVLEATVWDVAVHPIYHGVGLGKQLMAYILTILKTMGIEQVTLFADPEVVSFYERQGWTLEPRGNKCAFWYAS